MPVFYSKTSSTSSQSGTYATVPGSNEVQVTGLSAPMNLDQIQTDGHGNTTAITRAGIVVAAQAVSGGDGGTHWFKVLANSANPVAQQFSAANLASGVCFADESAIPGTPQTISPTLVYRDLSDAQSAFIMYSPYQQDTCQIVGVNSDLVQIANVSGSAQDNVLTLNEYPLAAIYDASGHLGGLLTYLPTDSTNYDEGDLRFISDTTNFASATVLATGVSSYTFVMADTSAGFGHAQQAFVDVVTTGPTTSTLHRVDALGDYSPSLGATPLFSGGNFGGSVADASMLYIVQGATASGTPVLQVPLDGSSSLTVSHTYPDLLELFGATDHELVLRRGTDASAAGYGYGTVPKSASSRAAFAPAATPTASLAYIGANALYFNVANSNANSTTQDMGFPEAVLTYEDGTLADSVPFGQWVGAHFGASTLGGVRPDRVLNGVLLARGASVADVGSGAQTQLQGAHFADVESTGQITWFTTAAGAAVSFSPLLSTIYSNTIAAVDTLAFATAVTGPDQIYGLNFVTHVLTPVTSDTAATNTAISCSMMINDPTLYPPC